MLWQCKDCPQLGGLMEFIHYVQENWFQMIVDGIAALNVIAAGARVMGWNSISEFCGKLEDAIKAMVQAALNRNSSASQTKTSSEVKS